MIMVRLKKDPVTEKRLVDGWSYVPKEYTVVNPAIPNERVYLDHRNVPLSFYKNSSIHYYENGKLIPIYPESVPELKKRSGVFITP